MYEIELKAWMDDRAAVEAALKTFAVYEDTLDKHDRYWRLDTQSDSHMTVRLRSETRESTGKTETFVTYKHKSRKEGFEVNEEHEFTVSNPDDFELILKDAGFNLSFSKHKTAGSWHFANFHIELCILEGLGEFFEIETFAEENTPEVAQTAHTALLEVLSRCGISSDKVESRYYSELYQLKNK